MSSSSLRCAAQVLLGMCLGSSTLQPAFAQRGETARCASTAEATPRGLIAVLPKGDTKGQAHDLQALNNPFMSGLGVQIDWSDIEPVEGKPDWSRLDMLFAAAESSNKWMKLDIMPGFFSPAWALQGAKTDVFNIMYGPGHGTETKLPMPWDPVYLSHWFGFLKQLAGRYGKSPAFRIVSAAGPTSVSEEMTLPADSPPAVKKWHSDGYTPAKYLAAWEETWHVYADAFPNQCVSVTAPGLPIPEQGQTGLPARMRAKQDIVERAVRIFGSRLVVQSNDLHAGQAAVEAFDGTDFIKSYSGRIINGFEMRGGSFGANPSKVMGAEGDPPLALRRSIDKGMAPNDAGRRVNFLEIYAGDVLAPEMQPVLQYAASLFHGSHP